MGGKSSQMEKPESEPIGPLSMAGDEGDTNAASSRGGGAPAASAAAGGSTDQDTVATEGAPIHVPAGDAGAGRRSNRPERRSSSSSRGSGGSAAQGRKPGIFRQLSQGYGELVNAIIRPPRAEYQVADLGPASFTIAGRHFKRTEVQVRNTRGLMLEGSWWEPADPERIAQELPCVVYMHGNSSCRLEVLELLPLVLQTGCMLFAFDFAGCGLSEGENITLGYHEKDDAREVIDYLRASGKVSTVALWGRSMGAATALLHGHRDPSIAAMVLDSPFSSLERLAREIIDQAKLRHKPGFLIRAFMKMMRGTILKRSGLDILKLRPIENVDTCFIPALFVAGSGDQFIPPKHASDICEQYAGDKNIVLVDGNHNSRRPSYFMDSVAIFFYNRLCVPAGLTEDVLNLRPRQPRDAASLAAARRSNRDAARGALGYSPSPVGVQSDMEAPNAHEQQDLQEALLASLVAESQGGSPSAITSGNGARAMASRLVGCATSQTQSTLPDRRSAAAALSGA